MATKARKVSDNATYNRMVGCAQRDLTRAISKRKRAYLNALWWEIHDAWIAEAKRRRKKWESVAVARAIGKRFAHRPYGRAIITQLVVQHFSGLQMLQERFGKAALAEAGLA